ncbi:Zinc transporter ZupT [Candidatus Tiddalikarchaeum anstoanum]|nr:Zinc transporter ZupT [Candidatus Tiddalikarchaeum anstoanum]
MFEVWFYSLISVFIVSAISLIGIIPLAIGEKRLRTLLIYMISFSAGTLMGDVFIHLIPSVPLTLEASYYIIFGVVVSLIVEKIIHWRHCHLPATKTHIHDFAYMNLIGDSVHNFLDGLVIGVSYLVSIPVGFASTIAVIFHEIPQEIGDFGVLLRGGFSVRKALILNFVTALTAVLGAVTALTLNTDFTFFLVPFAAGGFIYIAGSDLIPELHKECGTASSIIQILIFILGVLTMSSLLVFE